MEIAINSAEFSVNDMFIDGLPSIPSLRLQYDPPWDETSVGEHYHVMPLMAIGDVQLAYGMATDLEAIEFILVSHANNALADQANPVKYRKSVAENGQLLRDTTEQMRQYLVSEAMEVPSASKEEMTQQVFMVATEAGEGDISMARASKAKVNSFVSARTSLLETVAEGTAEDGLVKDSPGYQQLASLLSDHADVVETERRRIFDMKFGEDIDKAIGLRLRTEELGLRAPK